MNDAIISFTEYLRHSINIFFLKLNKTKLLNTISLLTLQRHKTIQIN